MRQGISRNNIDGINMNTPKVICRLKFNQKTTFRTLRTPVSNPCAYSKISSHGNGVNKEKSHVHINEFQTPVRSVRTSDSTEKEMPCENESDLPVRSVRSGDSNPERFRRIPDVELPLTDISIQIPPKDMNLIRGFTTRQPGSVQAWISKRQRDYEKKPWNERLCFVAAAFDLIIWQWRLESKPRIDAIKDVVAKLETFEDVFTSEGR